MSASNVTYAVEDVMGFCTSAKALLTTYKNQMIEEEADPTTLINLLDLKRDDLNTKNSAQEALKTQLRIKTPEVATANADTYATASQACDKIISTFGRTSQQAKEATNLRKSIRPAKKSATPPPTP